MKGYSHYGINEFVICLGYKGYVIKEFFVNYFMHRANITIDLGNNTVQTLNTTSEPWKVTLIDTGNETMTGGRIKRIKPYIGDEPFMLTYGDGVSDINIADLLKFHNKNGRLCTVTTVQPTGRFGAVTLGGDNSVASFAEKPKVMVCGLVQVSLCVSLRYLIISKVILLCGSVSLWKDWLVKVR